MSNNNEKFNEVNTCIETSDIANDVEENPHTVQAIFGEQPKKKFELRSLDESKKLTNLNTAKPETVTATATTQAGNALKKEEKKAEIVKDLVKEITTKVKKDSINSGERETLEPIYAVVAKCDPNICIAEKNEDLTFYKWVGNYWKAQSKKRAEADALTWLEDKYPTRATGKLAISCASTAAISLLSTRTIPPKNSEIIIPCRDRWLHVSETGVITNIEPNRNIGITHQINATIGSVEANYVPQALPVNSQFYYLLNSSIPNMQDQGLLQEWIGSTLLPDTRYQKAMVLEGNGSNGKGVITEVTAALHENVAAVNLERLDSFGLSELPDASLVVVSETPKKNINEESLKQLIAGDRVVIDIKQKSQFTCKPFAKWLISCNTFPKVSDETEGVWRRLIIMKFPNKFSGAAKNTKLAETIIANEMKYVLDWALLGLQRLLARGQNGDFIIPEHIKSNTDAEKMNSNNVAAFVDDMYIEYSEKPDVRKDFFYERYIAYCKGRSLIPFGDVQFWKRMTQRFPAMQVIQKREAEGKKRYINLQFDTLQADDCPF